MKDALDASRMATLLDALGAHLEAVGETAAIVVVGGAALALRGWVPRSTHDVDVIATADPSGALSPPPLPEALVAAVRRVARDFGLPGEWLNCLVARQWNAGLPDSLAADLQWRQYRALRVGLAGRESLLALKLFAAVDRGPRSVHVQDLLALAPSEAEMVRASAWVQTQDLAPEWPQLVAEVVNHVLRTHRSR